MNTNLALERTKYITAVVLYGTIGMFLRSVSLPSELVAMCRGTLGSIFILLFLRARNHRLDWESVGANRFWLILSGICLGLNWIFLFAAYIHTTVAAASLCNYMAPVIVVMIAPLVLHEPLNKKKIPCVIAAFVGIILVSGVWNGELGKISGVFMGLAAAFFFVIIVICNRKIKGVSVYLKAIIQLAISSVTILPYFIIHNWGKTMDLNTRSIFIILMLGILHTGVAYCLYFSGMATLPVQTLAVLGYLEPVVSVLCSYFFLHEAMGLTGWIGAVLILGAAIVSEVL